MALVVAALTQPEVAARIPETNVRHHFAQELAIIGKQAASHVLAQDVAQKPPKVLVPRVRQEAARIGQHADEA